MDILYSALLFVILISVLVIVHESGHFFAARIFGIKVTEFSVGMGPRLFKWGKKETEYSIRALPIGGYCKMVGEDEECDIEGSFGKKPVWQRMIVVCAGAFLNFVLGLVLFLIIVTCQPNMASTTVAKFDEDSLSCGEEMLREGDKIIEVDGSKVNVYTDISFTLALCGEEKVPVKVMRDGEKKDLMVSFPYADENKTGHYVDFYVYRAEKNFITVVRESFFRSLSTIRTVWISFIKLLTGKVPVSDVSGPVGMGQAVGSAAKEGILSLLLLAAFITMNLGVVNLMPLPALDGGRFVFLFIELISGRKVPQKYEAMVHFIGLVVLLMLMIFVTYNDITRLL